MDHTIIRIGTLALIALLSNACQQVLYVGPKKMDCGGQGIQQCFLVKGNLDENWVLQRDAIVGLEYVEGYQYKIKAKRERVRNPDNDGSRYQLKVTEVIEKKQIYEQTILLGGKTWELVSYGTHDDAVAPVDNSEVMILFDVVDQKVSGSSGCNRFFGSYKAEGNDITFSPLGSTMMACEQEILDQETKFLGTLQSARSFSIDEKTLRIESSDGRLLTFTHK